MKENRKRLLNRIVSFALAVVMMASAFAVSVPDEVKAATPSLNGASGKSSSWTISDKDSAGMTGRATYIKFKPSATGYITITLKNASKTSNKNEGWLTFCDSKKRAIGGTNEYWTTMQDYAPYYTRTYAVEKGKTYYFNVISVYGVKVVGTVKKLNKGKNITKASAKFSAGKKVASTIKKNKKKEGIILAGGTSKADWYKFTVSKYGKKNVTMKFNFKLNGLHLDEDENRYYASTGLAVTLYDSKGKAITDSQGNARDIMTIMNNGSIVCTLTEGTYYVKIERANTSSSGYYSLTVKGSVK